MYLQLLLSAGAWRITSRALATTAAADDDLDDFLNSLTDDAGPPAAVTGAGAGRAGAAAGSVNAEDLDKMLS